MALESEIVRLVLYATQQLGVTLAVGGQTVVLLAYLIAMRDRVVDSKEAQFSRAVKAVLFSGLGLVILSGIGITALHYIGGELPILFAPAYLFKWLLILLVVVFSFEVGKRLAPPWVGEGIVGGTWYALFLVHILAPVTTWENLLILYAGWLAAFFLIWTALVFGTREKATSPVTPVKKLEQKPVTATPSIVQPKPFAVPKPPLPTPVPLPNIPSQKIGPAFIPAPNLLSIVEDRPVAIPLSKSEEKITDPNAHPGLPAIRVMPKTKEDIDKEHRVAVVTPQ